MKKKHNKIHKKGKITGNSKEKEWDKDFKNFMRMSHQSWVYRYPKFRANYQGDKSIGYNISKKYVKIPEQYYKLSDIYQLTREHIQKLEHKQFAIKAVLGHQGNRVLLIVRDDQDKYRDVFRNEDKSMTLDELIDYAYLKLGEKSKNKHKVDKNKQKTDKQKIDKEINRSLKRKHKKTPVIVEEFLGDFFKDGIPPDYKVYTIMGRARIINYYYRKPGTKWEASFTRNWQRIPLQHFYRKLEKLGYVEHPEQDFSKLLPDQETRKKLIKTAEKLASVHQAKFCRYDFYCVDGKVYLGEITPVCGGIKNMPLRTASLKHLFPPILRRDYQMGRLNKVKMS